MEKQKRQQGQESPGNRYQQLRQERAIDLPAWALEEVLRRAQRSESLKAMIVKHEFPPGMPCVDVVSEFPRYLHVSVQRALKVVFADWEWRVVNRDWDDDFGLPALCGVAVGAGEREYIYGKAAFLLSHADGRQLLILAELENGGLSSGESRLMITVPASEEEFASQAMEQVETWVKEHNHLRGQKLDFGGRFIEQGRPYDWSDLIAEESLRVAIRRNTEGFLAKLDQYEKLQLPTRRGVLLHGRPGTGKTLIAKILCSRLEETFIWVKPGDVDGAGAVSKAFDMARDLSPGLLFFEDLDLFTHRRDGGPWMTAALGEFLNQMDGLKENEGLVVVGTTNDLDAIEPALKDRPSRFDCVFELPELSEDARRRYLKGFLAQRGLNECLLGELDRVTSEVTTIAEAQELTIRWLQRAIEAGVPLEDVTSLDDLPELQQPERRKVPIGFHSLGG